MRLRVLMTKLGPSSSIPLQLCSVPRLVHHPHQQLHSAGYFCRIIGLNNWQTRTNVSMHDCCLSEAMKLACIAEN